MSKGSKPRKKNTNADFVAAKYPGKYNDAIIQSLTKLFGVNESLKILQECANEKKRAMLASHTSIGEVFALPSKTELYNDICLLLGHILNKYSHDKNASTFYAMCNKQLNLIKRDGDEAIQTMIKYENNADFGDPGAANCINCYTCHIILHMATIAGMPECDTLVARINDGFYKGKVAVLMGRDDARSLPRVAHKLSALLIILTAALESVLGAKEKAALSFDCSLYRKKIDMYHYENGTELVAWQIMLSDCGFFIDL